MRRSYTLHRNLYPIFISELKTHDVPISETKSHSRLKADHHQPLKERVQMKRDEIQAKMAGDRANHAVIQFG